MKKVWLFSIFIHIYSLLGLVEERGVRPVWCVFQDLTRRSCHEAAKLADLYPVSKNRNW